MDILLVGMGVFAATCFAASLWLFAQWQKSQTALAISEARLLDVRAHEDLIDELKDHTVMAAKSAALEAGQQLSSKLLEDHKRENEAAREMHLKATKSITEPLVQQTQVLSEKLATIQNDQSKHAGEVSTIMKALTNPTGAGKIAEIGLENLLKSFGLESGRDFDAQYSITTASGRLRPDAVVYLPQNIVLVIDCKASQFLIDETADDKLKQTMSNHLRGLASKDYRTAVIADCKKQRNVEPLEVFSVMYLPTESLAQRAKDIDPSFAENLIKSNIILASPASLHGLLSFARMQIMNEKQMANSQEIVKAASSLLDGITTAFGHVESLSKSLKASMENFNKFAASANSSILGRASKLSKLGVTTTTGKPLPGQLPRYEVMSREIIESTAEVVELELIEKTK